MMKTLTIVILLTVISCSPKYTASFQNHNRSNSETKQVTNQILDQEIEITYSKEEVDSSSLNNAVPDELFTASTSIQPIDIKINQPEVKSTELISLSRAEKQSLKKQIKSEVKSSKQESKKEKSGKKSWNIFAFSGFGLSLIAMTVGIAFPPLLMLLIPSTIFSVLGLWSKKKGWAIAGLLVPIVIGGLILILLAASGWL